MCIRDRRNPISILKVPDCASHFHCDVICHDSQLAKWWLLLLSSSKINVVDVPAGSIGHDRDEWWVLAIGLKQLLQPIRKGAVVVGRNDASIHSAAVVQ